MDKAWWLHDNFELREWSYAERERSCEILSGYEFSAAQQYRRVTVIVRPNAVDETKKVYANENQRLTLLDLWNEDENPVHVEFLQNYSRNLTSVTVELG